MAARYYPAVIDRAGDGSFGISFPDFPGCVSGAGTLDQAIERGHEALAAHIGLMLEDGDAIPAPTPLAAVENDPEIVEVLRTLVRVDLPGRAARLSITMDEGLIGAVDQAAAAHGFTRSGFLAARPAGCSARVRLDTCTDVPSKPSLVFATCRWAARGLFHRPADQVNDD